MVSRDDPYVAKVAWGRALAFFLFCLVVAVFSGGLDRFVTDAGAQRVGLWPVWAVVTTLVVVNGYVVVWPRGTFTEDRPRDPGTQAFFGIAWGLSMGLLFVSIHELVATIGWSTTVTGLVAWFLIANFQGLWHQLYWDLKVSPPHNVTRWNVVKVAAAHVPNVSLSMVMLAHYGDARFLVTMQVIALTSSSLAMRFPPPDYVRSSELDAELPALEGA